MGRWIWPATSESGSMTGYQDDSCSSSAYANPPGPECINLGVSIAANEGTISGATAVVDMLRPDRACLWCKQFLRADRIAAEGMPAKVREPLQREGYVEDIDTKTPSVVSTTTTIAGMAVTLYLQLLTDFMGEAGDISRQNYDILDGTVRQGKTKAALNCICHKVRAFGDLKSIPTLSDFSHQQ